MIFDPLPCRGLATDRHPHAKALIPEPRDYDTASFHAAGLVAASTLVFPSVLAVSSQADTVNIYSTRQADLIEPVLDAFTAETGIDTRVLFVKKGLVDRLVAEGAGSPADVLLTTDIGGLLDFVNEGVTQPVTSSTIAANVPATLRDENDHWFALTKRGRVVYASVDRVEQDSITYEELADPKWKGRICTRSGQHGYNLALFASMIDELGEERLKPGSPVCVITSPASPKAMTAHRPRASTAASVISGWETPTTSG